MMCPPGLKVLVAPLPYCVGRDGRDDDEGWENDPEGAE